MEAHVCKHFQTGYCKFGDHCRKHHETDNCQTKNCTSKACTKRHQKICKYFTRYNVCKFGEKCFYKHTLSQEKSDVIELQNKVKDLEDTLKVMSKTIKVLEENIKILSTESKTFTSKPFKCDQCDYKAINNSVLKRHITSKHKPKIPAPENERNAEHDKSLQLDTPVEQRALEEEGGSPPRVEENQFTSSATHLFCEICRHKSDSPAALHGHMSLNHNPIIPHTGKWEDNNCHICNNHFSNTFHFKNHLIEQHGFSDESNECMNCESSEVGLYRAMPFQAVCMNCKDCELLEANM